MKYTSDVDKGDLLTIFGLDKKIQIKDTFFHNAMSALRKEVWKKIPFNEKATNIEDRILGEKKLSQKDTKLYMSLVLAFTISMEFYQNLNKKRAQNVVRILESLDTFQKRR